MAKVPIEKRVLSIAKENNQKFLYEGKFYLPDGSIQEIEKETIGTQDITVNDDIVFDKDKHQAKTKSKLAYAILFLFGGMILSFLILITVFAIRHNINIINELKEIFNILFAGIIGLVGTAIGFYFRKSDE